jgi:hypothetical protein
MTNPTNPKNPHDLTSRNVLAQNLQCAMNKDCKHTVSYIDSSGFIYCARHGEQRKSFQNCRKLTLSEIKTLSRGEKIASYNRKAVSNV